MLFSTPMVLALSNGSKTMTRRPQGLEKVNDDSLEYEFVGIEKNLLGKKCAFFRAEGANGYWAEVPLKIVKGDVIWGRETFFRHPIPDEGYKYKADYSKEQLAKIPMPPLRWKPSIHMPKEACRLWLKVKDVRVERLNKITEADAKAEGVLATKTSGGAVRYMNYETGVYEMLYPSGGFRTLWQSINGPTSWYDNPWVWVYEFEKIDKPQWW